jgi:beta-glucuronidase
VWVTVRDASGAEVARADGGDGTLFLEGVQLGRPVPGHLCTFEVEVREPGGELVDVFPQPFSMRTVAVDGHRS